MSSNNPETRNRILKAACDLLEASQGRGVRMTDIAKRAGITRQALYLHFSTRAELLIATTHHVDVVRSVEERLVPSRTAATGLERLDAYIEAWASYIPEIHGIAKALIAMSDTDDAAAMAWADRMQAMRHGCEAAINALRKDKLLSPQHSPKQATDLLWTLLSVRNWESLTIDCGWSQQKYAETLRLLARRLFVAEKPTR
ncbi:MAG: TetR/AcrR family transcriptional regulator [Proteobacteria bacterium]|nr:TetR/AcrR family transcriptional regulator [Pseudomonadota bacterium]